MVNIDGLTTETVNEATKNIDELDSLGVVTLISNEDKEVALVVEKGLSNIVRTVGEIAARFKCGGRIICCGAGSSEHVGTLDAVELTSTYSASPDRAFGLLAGRRTTIYKAVEGAKDPEELALEDLKRVQITKDDCIVGTAASGRTPYTISALGYANEVGALSISITCNEESGMTKVANVSIAPVVEAEVVSGSTHMKAGTAQEMIANMLSTTTMIRLSRVYRNYMVQVQSTSEKLVARATKVVAQTIDVEEDRALTALESVGLNVLETIITLEGSCDRETARKVLDQANGQVRETVEIIKK